MSTPASQDPGSTRLLLVNDQPSYGKVALAAMVPILSYLGYAVSTLPTALVSNTLDYGTFELLDTTSYLRGTLRAWERLGVAFDGMSTGFIASADEVDLLAPLCDRMREEDRLVLVDPIMGDDYHLYNGMDERTVGLMRRLVSLSSVTVPNYTEACYLTGTRPHGGSLAQAEASALVAAMREIAGGSVVITSCCVEGQNAVVGYDLHLEEEFTFPFDLVPVRFPGTGDIFSSVLMARLFQGLSLEASTESAMRVTRSMVVASRHASDPYRGLPIEALLELVDE